LFSDQLRCAGGPDAPGCSDFEWKNQTATNFFGLYTRSAGPFFAGSETKTSAYGPQFPTIREAVNFSSLFASHNPGRNILERQLTSP